MRPVPQAPSRSLLPVFVLGLCAVLAGQMAMHDPRYIVPLFVIASLLALPAYLARRRMRRLLISGDVERVLGTWEAAGLARASAAGGRIAYAETMVPLMAATAYAAYGWVERARIALGRAAKGPAWEATLEQRLLVEALLDTFEGDRAAALEKADALARMPMPPTGLVARRKVSRLRAGIGALARAFAHESRPGDAKALRGAAKASPLVHWAMRYAQAIVAVDLGRPTDVTGLLEGAPPWPEESAFRAFHDELRAQIQAST